jgi:hypothetical protein
MNRTNIWRMLPYAVLIRSWRGTQCGAADRANHDHSLYRRSTGVVADTIVTGARGVVLQLRLRLRLG